MPDEPKSFFLSADVHAYLVSHGLAPDALQRELIEETRRLGPIAIMQIAPEQGALLTVLARALGARRAIEVGTFTGYSSLCLARGLPDDGRLLTCDVSEAWTAVARRFWSKAGVEGKIDLRLGPALETLRALPQSPDWDLAFIDADKQGYVSYYEEILKRLRPNGIVLVDNVLWSGNVADASVDDAQTRHIRAFNDHVASDARVDCVMLAVADGLSLIRKREDS